MQLEDENATTQNYFGRSKALHTIVSKLKDGTFHEIIDDWKWIFSYSRRYKWAIAYYILLGIISSCTGLLSTEVSKNLIDIVTGYQVNRLSLMIGLMVGSTVFGLLCSSLISRVSTKISIYINNDIQADQMMVISVDLPPVCSPIASKS